MPTDPPTRPAGGPQFQDAGVAYRPRGRQVDSPLRVIAAQNLLHAGLGDVKAGREVGEFLTPPT